LLKEFPAEFLFIADSVEGNFQMQKYVIDDWSSSVAMIDLRHSNHGNVLFADGHVEACSKERLNGLGWMYAIKEYMD